MRSFEVFSSLVFLKEDSYLGIRKAKTAVGLATVLRQGFFGSTERCGPEPDSLVEVRDVNDEVTKAAAMHRLGLPRVDEVPDDFLGFVFSAGDGAPSGDDCSLPTWRTVPLAKITFEGLTQWVARLSLSGLGSSAIRQSVFVMSAALDGARQHHDHAGPVRASLPRRDGPLRCAPR
jgi:hypothetical protein